MKKQFYRLLTLILVVLMLIPMIGSIGITASAEIYSGSCGDNLTWTLDTSTGVLNITGTGDMTDYYSTTSASPWYYYRSYVKTVNIGNCVTSIGEYAFFKCTDLTNITIPDSVINIGYCAFYNCSGLTNITIPDSVTSIGRYAFYSCSALTSATIGNSVTTIGAYAFSDCTGLISVTIPDSVTTIGACAFEDCTGLISVTIPDSVTIIGNYAFDNTALYNNASNWDNKVLYIGNHLIEAKSSISESYSIKEGTLTIACCAFSYCKAITTITIPDSVTSIGNSAFKNCSGLTSVTIGNGVTSIDNYAFSDCTGLTSITIPDSVTSIDNYAFSGCTGLTSITIPDSVTSIGFYAFSGCTGLTNITFPDSVISIGYCAFNNCTGMSSITIGNSVTSIGSYAFSGCTNLTSVMIGNSATSIGYRAFSGCTGLTSVTIGNGVTSIGSYAFNGCTALTNVTIPDSVISIDSYAFNNCTDLTSVTIGNGVTSIGEFAFNNCTALTSVTIPDSVISIGDKAFYNCTALTSVTIGNGVTSTGVYTFYFCTALTNVTIGNSVTKIGDRMFYNCKSLTTITIPDSVTSIGNLAFHLCSGYTIRCYKDSYVYKYAINNAINYELLCKHHYTEEILKEATCSVEGKKLCVCTLCNNSYVEAIPVSEHTGDWKVSAEPTTQLEGERVFTCTACGYTVTEKLPKLDIPLISTENYVVFITCADYINCIRYAKGEYSTPSAIKSAEGCVTLNASKILSYSKDNVCALTMANGGIYSFFIKHNDGTEYIYEADLTTMIQKEPTFTENGLQLIIGNLDDIKLVRTAYGEYNTHGEIKRAEGSRSFSAKYIEDTDKFTLQYRNEGVVSVAVVYNDGHEVMYTYNVTKKSPTMIQEGSTITFRNLNDLKVIRYVIGEYTTSNRIKNTKGSVAVSSKTMTETTYSITLAPGIYTFCVQYNDESYNYYIVTIE